MLLTLSIKIQNPVSQWLFISRWIKAQRVGCTQPTFSKVAYGMEGPFGSLSKKQSDVLNNEQVAKEEDKNSGSVFNQIEWIIFF